MLILIIWGREGVVHLRSVFWSASAWQGSKIIVDKSNFSFFLFFFFNSFVFYVTVLPTVAHEYTFQHTIWWR